MNLHGNVVPRSVSIKMGLELSVGWLLLAYSVEKLCFEKSGDFICDLSVVAYSRYEGVVEAA